MPGDYLGGETMNKYENNETIELLKQIRILRKQQKEEIKKIIKNIENNDILGIKKLKSKRKKLLYANYYNEKYQKDFDITKTLAFKLFGKRWQDLTKEELKIYNKERMRIYRKTKQIKGV